tara:strand:+ start:102 stop:572 length:471 start_codon:yes stop_codon:yes gene_type:complete
MAKIIRFAVGQAKKAGRKARALRQLKKTREDLKINKGPKLQQKPAPKIDTESADYQSGYADDMPPMDDFDVSSDFDTQMALDEASANRIRTDTSSDTKGTTHGLDQITSKRIKTEVAESKKATANTRLPKEHKFTLRSSKKKKVSTKTKVLKIPKK